MAMVTLVIKGVNSLGKMAEIKPSLGEAHQFGGYWREGALCLDFWRAEEAHLTMANLNTIPGIKANVVWACDPIIGL